LTQVFVKCQFYIFAKPIIININQEHNKLNHDDEFIIFVIHWWICRWNCK